jgi:hypothetical protein
METLAADRLVLRALAAPGCALTLPGLHAAIARDPDSGALHYFAADIGAALARLLATGEVTVASEAGRVTYRAAAGTVSEWSSRSVAKAMSFTAESKTAWFARDGAR